MQNCFARACCWALVDFFETFFFWALFVLRLFLAKPFLTCPFSATPTTRTRGPLKKQSLAALPLLGVRCRCFPINTNVSTPQSHNTHRVSSGVKVPLFSHERERLNASISQHAQGDN